MDLWRTIWDAQNALVGCLMHPRSWPGALWRFGHVIWVCRVSVAGAAAGGFLLAYTVQARDLFADLGVKPWQWCVFFIVLFFWAWIVHAKGRRALQHDDWVPASGTGSLSYDLRRELQTRYWYPALWIPRLLSLVIFFFVGVAIVRTYRNLGPAAAGLPEAAQAVTLAEILLASNIGIALLYIGLIWKPRRAGDWVMTTEQGEPLEPPQWSHEPPLLAGTAPVFAKLTGCTRPTPAVPRELLDRTLSLVRVVIVAVLLFTIIDPHFFASRFPRLFFIPVLFGGAVVLLGEVAAWSMRWHTPLPGGLTMARLMKNA